MKLFNYLFTKLLLQNSQSVDWRPCSCRLEHFQTGSFRKLET